MMAPRIDVAGNLLLLGLLAAAGMVMMVLCWCWWDGQLRLQGGCVQWAAGRGSTRSAAGRQQKAPPVVRRQLKHGKLH